MLIDYYPRVVGQIREMKEICKAEQPEFDNISKEIDRLLANMFIATSDEHGIARFEEELGIVPTPEQSLEERRIVIMIRVAKKNLSFKDILNLIQNYSSEIDLIPDYDNDELSVIVGDTVNNVGTIYKTLDGILGLNIYIYFAHEDTAFLEMIETSKEIEMETTVNWWLSNPKIWCLNGSVKLDGSKKLDAVLWAQTAAADLETSVKVTETFKDITVTMQRDLWYLDGSVKLDGSKKLDAKKIKEGI